mmetsp:Transcript_36466/g.41605  ORF Transcript_36466/g.41605 Transcript_36466/m.41605 type:complete len:276 (-) Transcript_36466:62-889(-)|eukprot:CAMPEP_0194133676 /NCGR_PEP_ID=MMETSP0152-20130528/3746_1 /TAXON_ID=1049557 /ORGANISM="Thalassiothrix antarctica, Strain L6-D1" /LENGTH=275 /DNA_ID=CAMNT_0038829019 /DNA_START=103 /DNA_END=930 /DNA_ORIENTATION=+
MNLQIALLSLVLLCSSNTSAFSPLLETTSRISPLFMGRAAAVRALTKGKTDLKKTKTNALYGKKIIMAVKEGGSPSLDSNRKLAEVVKQAKQNNVPADNIARAIKKASQADTANFAESTFEAYGIGGASMVINVLSDNPNRANADVKYAVGKNHGKIAESGSVLFMYDRKGKIDVPNAVVDEEALLDAAIEADIDDFLLEEVEENSSAVLVEPSDAAKMFEVVKGMGYDEAKMSLTWITKAPVECNNEDFEANMVIIDKLEELDDVDSVEHNMSN